MANSSHAFEHISKPDKTSDHNNDHGREAMQNIAANIWSPPERHREPMPKTGEQPRPPKTDPHGGGVELPRASKDTPQTPKVEIPVNSPDYMQAPTGGFPRASKDTPQAPPAETPRNSTDYVQPPAGGFPQTSKDTTQAQAPSGERPTIRRA